MKTATLERRQILEEAIHAANFHQRQHALDELQAAIARILEPRGGRIGYVGSPATHFLPIPHAPDTALNKGGMPSGKVDEAAQAAFQQELQRVTLKERELEDRAHKAKSMVRPLVDWAVGLGVTEDRLLLSTLSQEDTPDVEAYTREHRRFLRTCDSWTNKLVF